MSIAERLADAQSRAMSPQDDVAERASAEYSALQNVDSLLARYSHQPERALQAIELSGRLAKLERPRQQLDELLSEVERLERALALTDMRVSTAARVTAWLLREGP